MIRSHLVHLLLQSAMLSTFFAVLLHDEPKRRKRFGGILFAALTLGTVILATLMAPFPR